MFHEWGALLRHQDEIDQKLQQENYEKFKKRQQNYKAELDKQYQELMKRKKGFYGDLAKKEEENLKFYEKRLEQRFKQDETKKIKLKNEQKNDAISGFTEIQIKKQQDERMREMEREINKEKVIREEKAQNEMISQSKLKRKQEGSEYFNILSMQIKEKQKKIAQVKESDKYFLLSETNKLNREENARSRFFNKLKKYQSDNEIKHKSLLRYMSQDSLAQSGKKDESSYLRNIQLQEKKAVK